ncbi:MAG: carotenoid 1,2-hydratase [Acidobacteriia bacterium]|nr:carotenoid 1,2-hydratase [Terriglobia bacterium]
MPFALLILTLFFATPAWRAALPGYHYQFPRDQFNHPDFRTEWWYYTGNLRARNGHRYGFELVFFRQGQRRGPSDNPSAWRVDDLYLAHLALTDIDAVRFRYCKRLNRAGPGIAGASFDESRIWNGNWEVRWDQTSGTQTLAAVAEGVRFNLRLTPRKALVIHGENGVSQTAEGAGNAAHYISFPRLAVEGTLNGAAVTGLAWMDHGWFSACSIPRSGDGTGSACNSTRAPTSCCLSCAAAMARSIRTPPAPTSRPTAARRT